MKTKSKLTYLINIIICMLIITGIYLGGIFILDYLNSHGFIKNHFSTFYQDAIRQSISVFGTFLTIGTTWSIYHMDSKKYKDKEIELRYIESRPFFHLKNIEGKKVINFKSLKQEGIVLINVKVFYFGFNARLLHIDELHDMSCGENDTGIDNYIVLDQEKYFLSQFIAVKATTIYNESVYFVNDCFEQRGYNFIKEINKNKSIYIVTDEAEKIKQFIMEEMNHTVTVFDVEGAYTNTKREILLTVIPSKEYFEITESIKLLDPNIFYVVSDAYEVKGAK